MYEKTKDETKTQKLAYFTKSNIKINQSDFNDARMLEWDSMLKRFQWIQSPPSAFNLKLVIPLAFAHAFPLNTLSAVLVSIANFGW
jgi:hypothetical protein